MSLQRAAEFVASLLSEAEVPYAVIGSVAVAAHGKPRATADVDVLVRLEPAAVPGFLDRIERKGLKLRSRSAIERKLRESKPAKVVWDRRFSFDLRRGSYSLDESAIERAENTASVSGIVLRLARAEELIVYKLARFELLDQGDILSILESKGNALDWALLRRLARKLSEEARMPGILERLAEIEGWPRG